MPKAADYQIEEIDLSHSLAGVGKSIFGVIGQTVMGDINSPSMVLSSWPQFVKYFGGLSTTTDFPLVCKKALDRGMQLRVCRIVNYTDITNSGGATAVLGTVTNTINFTFNSTNLKAGDGITITLNAITCPSLAFSLSHNNTMDKLAAHIKTSFPTLVQNAIVLKNVAPGSNVRTILVIKKPGGPAITINTGTVTGTNPVPTITGTSIAFGRNAAASTLMTIAPKARGAKYNEIEVYVLPPSNGVAGFFNLQAGLVGNPSSVELYRNIKLVATSATLQTALAELTNSALITVTPSDLTGFTDTMPLLTAHSFEGGTNGSAVTDVDFVGDSNSKTGLNAFDSYSDISGIIIPEKGILNISVTQSGSAYADNRKDIVYLADIPNSLTTETAIGNALEALNIDSSYTGFYGGGNRTKHPVTGLEVQIPILGDILGLISYTHNTFGMNYSYAGVNRGKIPNSMGPVNNFGSPSTKPALNYITNRCGNMYINRNNINYLTGNFTAQKAYSSLSFMNVRFLLLEIKKTLSPMLERYLEELNHWDTWLAMYHEVRPYFNSLVDRKALAGEENKGWSWQGDQFVSSLNGLTINNATDVLLGKYKVNCFLKAVPGLQDISLNLVLTAGGISFEEANNLI